MRPDAAADPCDRARAGRCRDNHEDTVVLVHGDYGPQNTLLDPSGREVIAVLDWEWAPAGDPVEDLASCEGIVGMHYPGHVGVLGSLFDAYGQRPVWAVRHQAKLTQCRTLLAVCGRRRPRRAEHAAVAAVHTGNQLME